MADWFPKGAFLTEAEKEEKRKEKVEARKRKNDAEAKDKDGDVVMLDPEPSRPFTCFDLRGGGEPNPMVADLAKDAEGEIQVPTTVDNTPVHGETRALHTWVGDKLKDQGFGMVPFSTIQSEDGKTATIVFDTSMFPSRKDYGPSCRSSSSTAPK